MSEQRFYCPCGWTCHRDASPCSMGCMFHDPGLLTARIATLEAEVERLREALQAISDLEVDDPYDAFHVDAKRIASSVLEGEVR